jgi:hypothetical protein
MTRTLWIIGLVGAIIFFAGMTTVCMVAWITHKHLNLTGFVMLMTNAFALLLTLGYLRVKLRERTPASAQEGDMHLPNE